LEETRANRGHERKQNGTDFANAPIRLHADGIPEFAEKNENFVAAEENKSVISSFVEEVINQTSA
jgi:hypothetical protein